MPQFRITAPDGTVYNVTGPEGSTEQEALAQIQAQVSPAPTPVPASPESQEKAQVLSSALSGFKGGIPSPTAVPNLLSQLGTYGLKKADEAWSKGAYEAGGKVVDVASSLGASPEVSAGLGFATNVGIQAVPVFAGSMGAGKVASPALKTVGKNMVQSALKPTLPDLKTGKAAQAIQTLIDEGVNVTPGGVAKLRGNITELNRQIAEAIMNSPSTVNKNAVWKSVKGTLDKFSRQVSPTSDINAIKGAWGDFINHPLISGDNIPVQLAQELKQGTYKVLSGKYGEMGSAATEAQKAIARGLKEEIATAVPEIAGLNAQESKLINALKLSERRALLDANKNPGGLVWLIHNPAAAAAYMADKSALFKSILGRMIYAGSERVPQAAAGVGLAGLQGTFGNKAVMNSGAEQFPVGLLEQIQNQQTSETPLEMPKFPEQPPPIETVTSRRYLEEQKRKRK